MNNLLNNIFFVLMFFLCVFLFVDKSQIEAKAIYKKYKGKCCYKLAKKIIEVSSKLEISNPEWLADEIFFESNFSSTIQNPYTKATGLIQFMPGASANAVFGYPEVGSNSKYYLKGVNKLRKMTPTNMYDYYKQHDSKAAANTYLKENPGIKTAQDYLQYVKKKIRDQVM